MESEPKLCPQPLWNTKLRAPVRSFIQNAVPSAYSGQSLPGTHGQGVQLAGFLRT